MTSEKAWTSTLLFFTSASTVLAAPLTGSAPIPVSPRRAAAFGAAMVSVLLLLQYAHRRKPFILLWACGWLLITPAMLLIAREYDSVHAARVALGLSEFLSVSTATLFLWSGDLYRQTGYVQRSYLKVLGAAGVWFLLSPLVFGEGAVLTPGYLLTAAILAAAGAMYAAVLLERRMIGAGLVALVLFGLAISSLTTAFARPILLANGQFVFDITLLNVVLYTLGALGIHQLVFEDMTFELRTTNRRLEAVREELMQAAITDPLTGCHNRRFLEQVMHRELQRHARFKLPLSLLFVDVNRFKAINDALGHEAGDRVLQYVARFLKRHIREADYVFRWGGDEFLVLMTCRADEARRKTKALKVAFDADPEAVELPPGVGLSVGSIEVPPATTDLMPLLNEADRRMYKDKGKR